MLVVAGRIRHLIPLECSLTDRDRPTDDHKVEEETIKGNRVRAPERGDGDGMVVVYVLYLQTSSASPKHFSIPFVPQLFANKTIKLL